MAYDYGVFKLYGNKQQNKDAIKSIQAFSGANQDGQFGSNSATAYNNAVNYPMVVGGTTRTDGMHTTPRSQWQSGFSDDYNKSLVSNVAQEAAPSVDSGGLGNYGYAKSSDGSMVGLDQNAFAAANGTMPNGNLFGSRENTSYGSQYYDPASESVMNKNMTIPDSAPKQTWDTYKAGGGTMDEKAWYDVQNQQQYRDNQTFGNYAGAGIGAIQTGLGVLNYFDQKAMNKKNSQLIDQQIANNQDIMSTRKARAADIQEFFGKKA